MVGALRRGGIPQSPALHRVAAHIHSSPGRSTCLRQTLPLSFVFGPERSLTQFKEVGCPQNTPWSPLHHSSLDSRYRTGSPSLGLNPLINLLPTPLPYRLPLTPHLAAQVGRDPAPNLATGPLNLRQVSEPLRTAAVGMLVPAQEAAVRV